MPLKKYVSDTLVAAVAVSVSYGISSLLRINHFVWTLLKDRYHQYMTIFLLLLLIWCCVYLYSRFSVKAGFIGTSVVGLVGGYVSSFVAFLLLPLYGAHAVDRVFTVRDVNGTLFFSPIIALGWINGLISVWVASSVQTRKRLRQA